MIYRALKPNPRLGRNFAALDPLEWLARVSDHIPDPGRHRTLFYGQHANRVRGERAAGEPGVEAAPGGEIRDEGATGRGATPKAGLCGFSV